MRGLEPRAAAARAVASRPLAVDTHGWRPAPHGYEGAEGQLQLSGWTARRRVLVRRPWRERPAPEPAPDAAPALPWSALVVCGPAPEYEYQVLVTNLTEELLTVADLYRPRADAENVCDELKNQWGSRRLHHAGSAALPGGRAGAAAVDGCEPVFERTGKHCGAVETRRVLGTDLGEDFGPVAAAPGGVTGSARVKVAGAVRRAVQNSAQRDELIAPFSGASPQLPDLG